ncbi:hypothetical protein L3X38_001440 [Prunus dulcis]|uniref:Uncharacterized protein n=1 Tax=Prunus dulcis TaxID=3755 RepID=A0AAD4WSJ6_PRUDU|nr:hypothetical protein L3X38_001440 [Prunus dulcis]
MRDQARHHACKCRIPSNTKSSAGGNEKLQKPAAQWLSTMISLLLKDVLEKLDGCFVPQYCQTGHNFGACANLLGITCFDKSLQNQTHLSDEELSATR